MNKFLGLGAVEAGGVRSTVPECSPPRCSLQASSGGVQRASAPSPPLEERAGERRPLTILGAAVGGDISAGCRTDMSGGLGENDGLLSLSLSSKGGEGNGAGVTEDRHVCKHKAVAIVVQNWQVAAGKRGRSW